MIVHALGSCDPRCPWCAREWWRWFAGRMRNPLAVAAATSVHGPNPGEEHAEPDLVFMSPTAVDAELMRLADELRDRLVAAFGIPAELLGFERRVRE